MKKDVIQVALLGLGTVGGGVYKVMRLQKPEMEQKLGTVLNIKKILVRNLEKASKKVDDTSVLTTDWKEIIEDETIDIVIELMGGLEPAGTYILQALEAGKSVVTANKDLMADRGGVLLDAASAHHADLHLRRPRSWATRRRTPRRTWKGMTPAGRWPLWLP